MGKRFQSLPADQDFDGVAFPSWWGWCGLSAPWRASQFNSVLDQGLFLCRRDVRMHGVGARRIWPRSTFCMAGAISLINRVRRELLVDRLG